MKHKFLHTLIVNAVVGLTLQASPVLLAPIQTQEQKPPAHSQIVIVDGEKKILLPDGRIIPFGQSTICTGEACAKPIASPPPGWFANNWQWAVPVTTIIVLCAVVLCRGSDNPSQMVPPRDTTTPIPEPATIFLVVSAFFVLYRSRKLS